MTVRARLELGAAGPVAVGGDSVWVAVQDASRRRFALVRLARDSGDELGRVDLGARLPRSLVAVGEEVWALIGDGTVLVIR